MASALLKYSLLFFLFLGMGVTIAEGSREYRVVFSGLDNFPELKKNAQQLSQLFYPEEESIVGSLSILRTRLKEDVLRIRSYLKAQGFYDVRVFFEISTQPDLDSVVLHIELGEQYMVSAINVVVNHENFDFPRDLLKSQKGEVSLHSNILEDKEKLVAFLKSSGHAFVETFDEAVEINHETLLVNINYTFKISQKGKFGPIVIRGSESVNNDFIHRFVGWSRGEQFNFTKLQEAERKLTETGLFEQVVIAPASINEDGEYPLTISVVENKAQHLRFGVYGSWEFSANKYEIGVVPKYMHDNVFGNGERFEASIVWSNVTKDANVSLSNPHMFVLDTLGSTFFSLGDRSYVDYKKSGLELGVNIDHKLRANLKFETGVVFENYSLELLDEKKGKFSFVSLPSSLCFDCRDNQFFSQSGVRLLMSWTPSLGAPHSLHLFSLQGSAYIPIVQSKWVLASWARADIVFGAPFKDTPLDKRIHLGGVGSLRGYASKGVGDYIRPQGLENTKTRDSSVGGLSGFSAGVESRMCIHGPIWGALFLDAGQISKLTNVFSEITEMNKLYWDFGVSFFYFTQFGPIRGDIAYPFWDPRKSDAEIRYYISFGQAF